MQDFVETTAEYSFQLKLRSFACFITSGPMSEVLSYYKVLVQDLKLIHYGHVIKSTS